jgi:Fe-S cluster assembly protein SufD
MKSETRTIADWYAARFSDLEKRLNGGRKSDVHALRRTALGKFTRRGFPTPAEEDWRFSNPATIAKTEFLPVLGPNGEGDHEDALRRSMIGVTESIRLVFIDGHYLPSLPLRSSLPKGVIVAPVASFLSGGKSAALDLLGKQANIDTDPFAALNTAFLQDGAAILVEDGVTLDVPVHLEFIASAGASPSMANPRILVMVGNGSRAAIVETYASEGGHLHWTNAVAEIVVGDHGVVEHDRLQMENESAQHVSSTHVSLGSGSSFTSNAITLGGAYVRNNVTVTFNGEHAEATLNGLSVATGSQLVDNHTTIDHAVPNCASHELYASILDGSARGVFNGKIFVRKDAQKTDAKQTNRTLLLSDSATIDTKPQLEIFADDVKCTHGATVGQLSAEQIFYLRSRGIGEQEARDILTFAFAGTVVSGIHVQSLRERLETMLHDRLGQGRVKNDYDDDRNA